MPLNTDDLLSQATCAVLWRDSSAGNAADYQAIATAWLATDLGHLVTAGHTFFRHDRRGQPELDAQKRPVPDDALMRQPVMVQFPTDPRIGADEGPLPADIVQGPVYEPSTGLDFAILKLQSAIPYRQPMRYSVTGNVSGAFRLRGYGTNLPRAQSGGTGTFVGPTLRENSADNLLFILRSPELAFGGYSGGAVYSEESGAVVATQIAAIPNSQTVIAMPLSRIVRHWEDLASFATKPVKGLCVVLFPRSRDSARVQRILDDVIRPVVERDLNLNIYTSERGTTTREDINMLEQADLLIADVTDADTNVIYELTIAQGIGTPDVIVAEQPPDGDDPSSQFSVSMINWNDVEKSRQLLRDKLINTKVIFEALGEPPTSNPITQFFRVPLTQISAANGLALGYFTNLVAIVGRLLRSAYEDGLTSTVKIRVDGKALTDEQKTKVVFDVVLPDRLAWVNDSFIAAQAKRLGNIVNAEVDGPGLSRPREMKALQTPDTQGVYHLLDIFPTTMNTLVDAIDQRLDTTAEQRATRRGWREIELKEIDRFKSSLIKRINRDTESIGGLPLQTVVRVVSWRGLFPHLAENAET